MSPNSARLWLTDAVALLVLVAWLYALWLVLPC